MQNDHTKKFDIGNQLGQFRIIEKKQPIIVWSRKSYMIGKEIKIAGIVSVDEVLFWYFLVVCIHDSACFGSDECWYGWCVVLFVFGVGWFFEVNITDGSTNNS